jgi:hypothetical protein
MKMTDPEIIEQQFNDLVRKNHRVYLIKDPEIRNFLKNRKLTVAKQNRGIKPQEQSAKLPHYKCLTCGTKDKENPLTGYCFICDTDNWQVL